MLRPVIVFRRALMLRRRGPVRLRLHRIRRFHLRTILCVLRVICIARSRRIGLGCRSALVHRARRPIIPIVIRRRGIVAGWPVC